MSKIRRKRSKSRNLFRSSAVVAVGVAVHTSLDAANAQVFTWLGVDGDLSDPTKWVGGVAPPSGPGITLEFPAAGSVYAATNSLDPRVLSGINVINGAPTSGDVTGTTLEFVPDTFGSAPFIHQAPGAPGTFFFTPIVINADELVINATAPTPSSAMLFLGPISDGPSSAGVRVQGGGIVGILGSNDFSGGVLIDGSTELHVVDQSALGFGPIFLLNEGLLLATANGDFTGREVNIGDGGGRVDTFFTEMTFNDIGDVGTTSTTQPLFILGGGRASIGGTNPHKVKVLQGSTVNLTSAGGAGGGINLKDGTLEADGPLDFSTPSTPFAIFGEDPNTIKPNGFDVDIDNLNQGQVSSTTSPLLLMGAGKVSLGGIGSRSGPTEVMSSRLDMNDPRSAGTGGIFLDNGTLGANGDLNFASNGIGINLRGTGTSTINTNGFTVTIDNLNVDEVSTSTSGVAIMGGGRASFGGVGNHAGPFTVTDNTVLEVTNPAASAIGSGPVRLLTGGELSGDGVIGGPVVVEDGAGLDPGLDGGPGVLDIHDTLELQPGSHARVRVGAPGTFSGPPLAGDDFDQINVTDGVTLSGRLEIEPFEPLDPRPPLGTEYPILTAQTKVGMFDELIGSRIDTDFAFALLDNFPDLSSASGDATSHGGELILRASIPGDTNFDDAVSVADLSTFALNFGTTPGVPSWHLGDFNGDGAITVADLSLLALNFGFDLDAGLPATGLSLDAAASLAGLDLAVPEPGTLGVLLVTATGLLRLRRPRLVWSVSTGWVSRYDQ